MVEEPLMVKLPANAELMLNGKTAATKMTAPYLPLRGAEDVLRAVDGIVKVQVLVEPKGRRIAASGRYGGKRRDSLQLPGRIEPLRQRARC